MTAKCKICTVVMMWKFKVLLCFIMIFAISERSFAGKMNETIYCEGASTEGIGSVSSDQFWALNVDGQMNRIEVNVYSNYSERVYIQLIKEDGYYEHVILEGIASSHTFMLNESNPPVEIKCRAANKEETIETSLLDRQSNAHCARVGGLDSGDVIKNDMLRDREALRSQVRRDMERYRRLKDECGELAKVFRERANLLKSILLDFTRESARNASKIGAINDTVLGVTSTLIPALDSAKGAVEAHQKVPYVRGGSPPPAPSGGQRRAKSNEPASGVSPCGPQATSCY